MDNKQFNGDNKTVQSQVFVVDKKEETNAITQMIDKLKSMESAMKSIDNSIREIDAEKKKHITEIKEQFRKFRFNLNLRELLLIKNVHDFSNAKKDKLNDIQSKLNKQYDNAKKQTDECKKKMIQPIELNEIDKIKNEILTISRDINNISVISRTNPAITHNKMNLLSNENVMYDAINKFMDVLPGDVVAVPVLRSLTNDNDCNILIKWKLDKADKSDKSDNNNNNNHAAVRVFWIETKSNDINIDDFDEKYAKNREFKLENKNNKNNKNNKFNRDISIKIDNKVATYAFIIKYFNGKQWSLASNIRNIAIKKVLTDTYDKNYTGSHLKIVSNSISVVGGNYHESSYLSRVVNKGIHHWTFRIDKYSYFNQIIGVWNTLCTQYPLSNKDTYLWNSVSDNQFYGFVFGNSYHYAFRGSSSKQYGCSINNGDIIEMILDLNKLVISFKINNTDYGAAYNIVAAQYRAAITLYTNQTKFTLLSYKQT